MRKKGWFMQVELPRLRQRVEALGVVIDQLRAANKISDPRIPAVTETEPPKDA